MSRRLCSRLLATLLFTLLSFSLQAAQTVNIAVLYDGPIKREVLSFEQIKKEIIDLNGREFNIQFPEQYRRNGNWNTVGIRRELKALLNEPNVDIIIANGLLSSHQAALLDNLKKPVIAPVVADRILQNLPYQNGVSGKNNYVYISENKLVGDDLRRFSNLVGFKHLLIPADHLFLEAIPELRLTTQAMQTKLGFKITMLPIEHDLMEVLDTMPPSIDAVYYPPLQRFSANDFKQLNQGFIKKRIPTYSLIGREEVKMGVLAASGGRESDNQRYTRRIALYVQSILLGANPANLKVKMEQSQKLAINMKTAQAIGFSPSWQFLEEADLLYLEQIKSEITPITLYEAIDQAVNNNLSLRIAQINPKLSQDNLSIARAALLPQLNIAVGTTQLDSDTAQSGQVERSSDASLNLSQSLYSERLWSSYDIAELNLLSEDMGLKTSLLDTISNTASTYLNLLQTLASEKVRQSNAKVTEANLELAQSQFKLGSTNRSAVLRWQSQLATDRQDLYQATASREQAETSLKQQLNIPQPDPISITDEGIKQLLTLLAEPRFNRFFANPKLFQIFAEFETQRAIENAPELQQLDYAIDANERQLSAAKRSFYLPDVDLNASLGQNINRSGINSNLNNLNDDDWSVTLQATLPLFTSGERRSNVSSARHTLTQNSYQKQNTQQQIEVRIASALQSAGGSYPAMRLSADAVTSAKENLSLVTETYSQGTISIAELIDAQNNALQAQLNAVNSQYRFMLDWIEIQRSIANFDLLLTPNGFDQWYELLDAYYQQRNK
jgi:outer membrane protein TolC